jgi:hypothetical protein
MARGRDLERESGFVADISQSSDPSNRPIKLAARRMQG